MSVLFLIKRIYFCFVRKNKKTYLYLRVVNNLSRFNIEKRIKYLNNYYAFILNLI